MEQGKIYTFHDFTLDLGNASLRQGQTQHRLRPKAFAMLRYFVERPAQLISKDELFRALWPNIVVDDATLTGCVRELRAVLNDNAKHPRFIETVPTRGYRWVAASATLVPGSRFQVSSSREEESLVLHGTWNGKRETVLVGRDTELTQLHRWLDSARSGERQVVFVTGEPGIGKTSLIDVFLSEVRGLRSETYTSAKSTVQGSDGGPDPSRQPLVPVFIGRGQCVKQYGANEAYLPVFEAMEHLAKGEHREHVLAVLHQYAPTWLVQMPGLLSPEDVRLLQARIVGATRERMLREIAEAFEVLTREQVLILWFDDLHDSDPSTLDLLTYLARRQQPARLLLLGTYRPAEALTHPHGLPRVQQELRERRQWQEVTLTCLDEPTVAHYLTLRLTGKSTISLSALAHAIHCRTEGHPLFLVSLVEDLQAHHLLVQQQEQWKLQVSLQDVVSRIPATLYGTLSGQFHSLSPEEQTALEAASVAGLHFTVPVISAATGQSPLEAEEICESLVRRERFIFRDGVEEWPDATLATRYRFRHAFHQDVAYQRIPPLKRSHLHQKIGERKEQAFASEVGSTAVELAMHFEGSRDYGRAAHYLQQAGAQAVRRSAYNEALSLVTKGLAFLRQMPDSPQRPQLELGLHMVLASSLSVTKGASAVEVGQSYHRALELCRQERDDPQIFPALAGLFGFYLVRAEYQTAYELGGQLLHLAERQATPILRLMAHLALGVICLFRGELSQAAAHFGQRSALYDSRDHLTAMHFGHDPAVTTLSFGAFGLWLLGYPVQAVQMGQAGVTLARQLSHPYSENVAGHFLAQIFQCCRYVPTVWRQVEANLAISNEQGFLPGLALNGMLQGWVRSEQGDAEMGIAQIRQGLTICQTMGVHLTLSYHFALLAAAYARAARPDDGLVVLNDALQHIEKTGERYYEAEIYRLCGELTLAGARGYRLGAGEEKRLASSVQGSESRRVGNAHHDANNGEAGTGGDAHPTQSAPSLTQNSSLKLQVPSEVAHEVERCFLKAIAIARQQQAKSLELRAVMSLVRLRQHQPIECGSRNTQAATRDQLAEAHKMLSNIYNWFTEGFDTADLQEAKQLLEVIGVNKEGSF